jgi:GNAT superfamily N-acetyltransferase
MQARAGLRQLDLDDMDAAAVVHRASFDARLPWLAGRHSPEEDRAYFRDRVFAACMLWGAFEHGRLIGFIAFREGWVDQLYVLPHAQRRGIGKSLLDIAKAANAGLSLWTFQRNEHARSFYEANGFLPVEVTDGSRNEEQEPDILYRWRRA